MFDNMYYPDEKSHDKKGKSKKCGLVYQKCFEAFVVHFTEKKMCCKNIETSKIFDQICAASNYMNDFSQG